MNPFWEAVAFYAVAALIVGGALAVVLMRNIVHCAMALSSVFLGVGGIYILLNAFFLFGVQLLIYVGAITILVLFAVMLTRDHSGQFVHQTNKQSVLAFAAASATFVALLNLVATGQFPVNMSSPPDSVVGIGVAFVSRYVIAFELASIVLLVALVGAIVIAREKEAD